MAVDDATIGGLIQRVSDLVDEVRALAGVMVRDDLCVARRSSMDMAAEALTLRLDKIEADHAAASAAEVSHRRTMRITMAGAFAGGLFGLLAAAVSLLDH